MKKLISVLAGAALLSGSMAAPALAQSHAGGGGHVGVSHAGGFHGGSGGHWAGGYRGGGYRGGGYYRGGRYYGGAYALGGLGLGLFLGSAFSSPSYYYGYTGYYDYPGYYEYDNEPAPPPYAYDAPPPPAASAPSRQACGAWKWDPSRDQYFWIPC